MRKISDYIVYNLHEYGVYPPNRELYLHRYIHSESETEGECGVDYRMATGFIKNLRLLDSQSSDPILIHMQSRGGDWHDGMAIYDTIRAARSHITILAYAHARSMTSIIFQAADRRVLMPNCIFLAHLGFVSLEDRIEPALVELERLKIESDIMLEIYAWRCISGKFFKKREMDEKQIKNFIRKKIQEKTDWILSAKEAVNYGFADGILGTAGYKTIQKLR